MNNEWGLIGFSLLVQLSIGVLLAAIIVRKQSKGNDKGIYLKSLYLSIGAVVLAMILSTIHLGDPIHAYRAITRVGASWLSNEIFFSGVFLFALLILFWMERFADVADTLKDGMSYLALLAGIVELYVMAKLYMVSQIPAWQSAYTLLQFVSTAVILGMVAVLWISRKEDEALFEESYIPLMVLLAVAVGLELVFLPAYLVHIVGHSAAAASGFTAATGLITLRWGMLFLGILTLALYGKWKGFWAVPAVVYTGAVLVIVSQFLSRYLFYACAAVIQIGMM
jgi:anaerobic dimethyl sulfoxide reductase subunit C (anchor subunit)